LAKALPAGSTGAPAPLSATCMAGISRRLGVGRFLRISGLSRRGRGCVRAISNHHPCRNHSQASDVWKSALAFGSLRGSSITRRAFIRTHKSRSPAARRSTFSWS
jgi:hypothetical protein